MISKKRKQQKSLFAYTKRLSSNPARTIMLSFAVLITIGTVLLMCPFTATSGNGLNVFNALFEATSAVCVTGLVVVDTGVHFTLIGQIIILILIQIGGLGIMILSFFTIYLVRRRVSLKEKLFLQYMLSEDDTGQLFDALKAIVITTFSIEGIGFCILFIGFFPLYGFSLKTVWYALFHAISAFCNGGFSLFSNSLESFTGNFVVTIGISFLIVLGSLGFGVIANCKKAFKTSRFFSKKEHKQRIFIDPNSRVVIKMSLFLIILGAFLFYALEFQSSMASLSTKEQYLAAFFQSITMRTAGFNSVNYKNLNTATYLILCVFMFIGAASGSTGGGVKVGTIAVVLASFKSFIKGEKKVHIENYEVDDSRVKNSFIVLTSAFMGIFIAIIILSLTEQASLVKIIFEVVSAIGTVGVSAGLTSQLSLIGRIVVIFLMFWGRIGALTMLSAASLQQDPIKIRWPQADIAVG